MSNEENLNFSDIQFFNDKKRFWMNRQENAFYIFDQNSFEFMYFDDDLAKLLTASNEAQFNEVLKQLEPESIEQTSFFINNLKEIEDTPPVQPAQVIKKANIKLNLSSACNMNCLYCFRDKENEESGDNWQKAIDDMVFGWAKDHLEYTVCFNLTGEPLLNIPLIETIHEYTKKLGKKIRKTIEIFFITNGTIHHDRALKVLKEVRKGKTINISLDGPQEVNDSIRKFKNNQGSYSTVVKSLEVFTKKGMALKVEGVVSKDFPWPEKIVRHCLDLGFKKINLKPIRRGTPVSFDEQSIEILKEGYTDYFKFLIEAILDKEYYILNALSGDYALRPLRRILFKHRLDRRCPWNIKIFSMDHKGDYYPCDGVMGMEQFKIGNISTGIPENVDKGETSSLLRTPCVDCWARFICSGTCHINSFYYNGDYLSIDPVECSLNKFLAEQNLQMFVELSENGFDPLDLRPLYAASENYSF